jgi:Winged helix-turn helix
MIERGPIPAIHGVVRWRVVDLCQWVFEEFRVTVAKQTLSRELRAMGYRKLSARPRHHAQAEGAIGEYKKRMARPVCKRFFESADDQSAATYGFGVSSQPRWRYARSRPHKLLGFKRRFLYQASSFVAFPVGAFVDKRTPVFRTEDSFKPRSDGSHPIAAGRRVWRTGSAATLKVQKTGRLRRISTTT